MAVTKMPRCGLLELPAFLDRVCSASGIGGDKAHAPIPLGRLDGALSLLQPNRLSRQNSSTTANRRSGFSPDETALRKRSRAILMTQKFRRNSSGLPSVIHPRAEEKNCGRNKRNFRRECF